MDQSNNDSVEVNCCVDPENQHHCELDYVFSLPLCILKIKHQNGVIVDDIGINQQALLPTYQAMFYNWKPRGI